MAAVHDIRLVPFVSDLSSDAKEKRVVGFRFIGEKEELLQRLTFLKLTDAWKPRAGRDKSRQIAYFFTCGNRAGLRAGDGSIKRPAICKKYSGKAFTFNMAADAVDN